MAKEIFEGKELLILAGEGTMGRFSRYKGKRTWQAIRSTLTKERVGGDRWAYLYVSTEVSNNDRMVYVRYDDKTEQPTDHYYEKVLE